MLRLPSEISPDQFESLKIQEMTFVAYRSNIYPARNEVFFEEYAVIFILEGEKKFANQSQDTHVHKGNVLFVERGYYLMNESIDSDYRSLVFFFNEKLLKEFVAQNLSIFDQSSASSKNPGGLLNFTATPAFEKFTESIFPYFQQKLRLQNQFLRLKFQELLLHLIEIDSSGQLKNILFDLYTGQKAELDFLINKYYLKPLNINELARLSGRSLSAFKRDFQEQFSDSPANWIRNKRLEYAAFLLKNAAKNVTEIAQEVGFESVSHFIKAFKNKYGFTPKKFD
jgi:AraC family transcriptional regulator, exoenzyme S synthesis regulatory protein ExsA